MSRVARMRSYKYLNQLALSERDDTREAEGKYQRERMRLKLKSLNQFALSDPLFFPDLPSHKSLTCSTIDSSHKRGGKVSLRDVANPEREDLPESRGWGVSWDGAEQKTGKINKVSMSSKSLFENRKRQYCFDCDECVQLSEDHSCNGHFSTLQQINRRLSDLCTIIATNKCEKFTTLSENSLRTAESLQMTMLISFLRHNQVYYTPFELFLRRRLINLSCKKLALLLENEDKQ